MRMFDRIIGVPGISNLGIVRSGAVYRSAQPDWEKWKDLYLRFVLNLREESEENDPVFSSGRLKYFQLRLNVLSDVTVDDFDLIVKTLSNPENQPILVHCYSGVDRTGVACAAYRMAHDGWTLDEAWEEAEAYGTHKLLNMKLKYHLENYAAAKGFK
jgi:tyrosine-protein phosphatase SIW14